MTLEKGHKLGPYVIEAPAGAGGMGEVYRASDTRLDRTVAIKVLPSQTAMSAEARARFKREAKTISSLNHPNICTLHDIGNQDGTDYIVMELLEGETLEARLKRGRLESGEALEIGIQVAAGLEAAHRKGLVHRDLKPGNIFLTKEGPKLLDFGLAKLRPDSVEGMNEETHTTPVTGAGAIVGTLQYMAPEQLEGMEADARSDIFAFGATMYEMVTGARAFSGQSKASLIGSIMKEEPRTVSEILPASPPALDRLIQKCLRKDPEERWQSSRDLKDELEWIASAGSQAGLARPVAQRRRFHVRLSWTVAALAAAVAVFFAVQWYTREIPDTPPMRFSISKPAALTRVEWPQISPDGRHLAFLGYDSAGVSQIWIRPLSSRQAYPLAGTQNTYRSFWSPDSRYLAFFDQDLRQIMKVPVSGGQPQLICKAGGADGTWGQGDIILFDSYQKNAIGWVPATGGEPRLAVGPDSSEQEPAVAWPDFLPDGRHFVYVTYFDTLPGRDIEFKLKVGSLDGDVDKSIGAVESQAIYCHPGYLLYVKEGYLVAHRFDTEALELRGDPVPITDSIGFTYMSALGINASVSDAGALVWKRAASRAQRLVWVDRAGRELDTLGRAADYRGVNISPDDSRMVCNVNKRGRQYIKLEIADVASESMSQVTFGEGHDLLPAWSADGAALAYVNYGDDGVSRLTLRSVYGATSVLKSLHSRWRIIWPLRWTERGRLCYFDYGFEHMAPRDASRDFHLLSLNMSDTTDNDTLLELSSLEVPFEISPDGRYFLTGVYWGLEPGLFVHDLSAPGRKWRLPVNGTQARWSPLGDEIFCFSETAFMSIQVDLSDGFRVGTVKKLFTRQHLPMSEPESVALSWDVTSDAQRFLFITASESDARVTDDIEVVLNWNHELEP